MDNAIKKWGMPRVLKFSWSSHPQMKSGFELGMWFAAAIISFNLSMGLYGFISNKIHEKIQEHRFKKFQKEMEAMEKDHNVPWVTESSTEEVPNAA